MERNGTENEEFGVVKRKESENKKEEYLGHGCDRSCGLLEATADNAAEHVDTDTLALDLAAGLVLLVGRDADDITLDLPAADVGNELGQGVTAAQVEPLLEGLGGDGAEGLANLDGDADADELLETGDIGGQISVQVIRVQGGPELGVLSGLEEGRKAGELLDGLDKVGGLRGSLGLGGGREGLSVGGEQSEAEREGGGREHSQGLDQDVGDGVGLEEVGVELVTVLDEKSAGISTGLIIHISYVKK